MFGRFVKPAAFKPVGFMRHGGYQARFLATVEGSVGRQMPISSQRSTPISRDRATFTIRVSFMYQAENP